MRGIQRSKRKLIGRIVLTVVMAFLGIVMISPILWMISTSFKMPLDIFTFPVEWIPKNITFANYEKVWGGSYEFWRYYLNSLWVTVLTITGAVFVNTLAGYAFARLNFKGRDVIFLVYLSALMIPNQVTLIPKYFLFHLTGLLNTHTALILPGIFQVLCVFLMRQFFMQVPFDYTEAARIDGAGEFMIFSKVIMPLAKPALVTTIIMVFTWTWNDYENPLIFLTSEKYYTLPLGLNHFVEEMGTQYGPLMAASMSSILLILVVFLIGQRWFIEGLTNGGVKG